MTRFAVWPAFIIVAGALLLCWLALRAFPDARRDLELSSQNPRFYPQLEGLRGLLALGVVIHHSVIRFLVVPQTHTWQYPPSVFYSQLADVPVLMFFFLTGFLFWSKVLRRPKLELLDYLRARFKRLAPVYTFAMLCLILLVAVKSGFALHATKGEVLTSIFRWVTFSLGGEPNINGLQNTWYLIAGTPWTLAYEWKFYVLLPLLLWFAKRSHRTLYLVGAFGIIFAVTHFLAIYIARPVLMHALLLTHDFAGHLFFSFGVGILVAMIRFRWNRASRFAESSWVSAACLVLFISSAFLQKTHFYSVSASLLLGTVFLGLVYGNTLWGLLTLRPTILLGKFSYSLYLCHGLVLTTYILLLEKNGLPLENLEPEASWLLIGSGCLLAVFAALLCYRLVESRFLET